MQLSPLAGFLAEMWRYRYVVPTVAALTLGAVAAWVVRQPKIYEASSTLEYDPSPSKPLGSAVEDTSGSAYDYWNTHEFFETQNFILRSRSLAEDVARRLRLYEDPSFMGGDPGSTPAHVERAGSVVMAAVNVDQVRDTRVVRIRVQDTSPERAQLIANSVAEAYIDKSLEDRLGSSARALEWLGNQMEALKRDVETSELALYKFREEHHALSASLSERQKIIAGQLSRYSETITEVRARRVQAEARLSVLREMLASERDIVSLHVTPISTDEGVLQLRAKYREASDALQRLSVTYGEAHPDVRAATNTRDTVLAQLREQIAAIADGIQAEVTEFERAEQGIARALDQVNQEGLQLSLQEIEYSRLDRERSAKTELYGLVMERAAQTDLTRAMKLASARVIDTAILPANPISPRLQLVLVVGALAGIILGILAAVGVSYLDNKVRGPADMEARNVAVLGVLPSFGSVASIGPKNKKRARRKKRVETEERDLIVHLEPRGTTAECCRTIRTNITFQSADHPLRTLAVTSAMPRDGKTTVSISVATVLAQSGKRVLLIDTDLRKPRLHRAFKQASGPGVTSVLAGESRLEEATRTTEIPNLLLLQCGPIPPNPSELLHTRKFAELIENAKSLFDVVVLDSPPLGAVTDPAIISTQVDGTIVVVRSRRTTRGGLDAALRQLRDVSARVIGVVLNGVDLGDSSYGSYYAYYRGYYAEDDDSSSPGPSTDTVRGGA